MRLKSNGEFTQTTVIENSKVNINESSATIFQTSNQELTQNSPQQIKIESQPQTKNNLVIPSPKNNILLFNQLNTQSSPEKNNSSNYKKIQSQKQSPAKVQKLKRQKSTDIKLLYSQDKESKGGGGIQKILKEFEMTKTALEIKRDKKLQQKVKLEQELSQSNENVCQVYQDHKQLLIAYNDEKLEEKKLEQDCQQLKGLVAESKKQLRKFQTSSLESSSNFQIMMNDSVKKLNKKLAMNEREKQKEEEVLALDSKQIASYSHKINLIEKELEQVKQELAEKVISIKQYSQSIEKGVDSIRTAFKGQIISQSKSQGKTLQSKERKISK